MYLAAHRTHPGTAAVATAASEAAAQAPASAVPKRQPPAVDDAVDSGEEEVDEPVPKRWRNSSVKPSEFVGVSWDKKGRKWTAKIMHGKKRQHLGCFDDEQEAARAVDTAARRLRSENAHGGRSGRNRLRLNFPTEGEVKRAKERGAVLTKEDKTSAAAAPSTFVAVTDRGELLEKQQQLDILLEQHGCSSCAELGTLIARLQQENRQLRLRLPDDNDDGDDDGSASAAVPKRQQHNDVAPSPTIAGRRLEYRFDVDQQPQWFGGNVLRDIGDHWVDVLFDDGAELCVKISTVAAGTAWRWLEANETDSDQAVACVDAVKDEVHEPALKRRKSSSANSSEFVGVTWNKRSRKWVAVINCSGNSGNNQSLGYFNDEQEAARAVDAAARRLRGNDAHGGRRANGQAHGGAWHRLNFPTGEEVKRAKERGALRTTADRAAAVAASEQHRSSEFVGVSWHKSGRRWTACVHHDGKQQHLGSFDDEREAARAFDTAARRLRGEDAHRGRATATAARWQLNFPTEREVVRAKERDALQMEEANAVAAAASARQRPSAFEGVSWDKRADKWRARFQHDGERHNLGCFDDEWEAARAFDTAARRLRGVDAHGGRSGTQWLRLNFPTEGEVKRAKDKGMPLKDDKQESSACHGTRRNASG